MLADHGSVAAIFWTLLGVALVLAAAVAAFVPETPVRGPGRARGWAGAMLLAGGMALLLAGIAQGNAWGWASARILLCFATGASCLAALAFVERLSRGPSSTSCSCECERSGARRSSPLPSE